VTARPLRLAPVVLAGLGACVAGWVLLARETGAALACTTGGCEAVQSSPYAELAGLPVAALGLAGYLTLAAVGLADGERARTAFAALALAGVVFGAYLLYVQLAVIGAVCDWCLASDALIASLAAVAVLRLRQGVEA
jgi:uncharacterized membrane protein